MSSARRLLMAMAGGGGFLDVGYTMSANEVAYWQDQAALLDPDAYEYVVGFSESDTVPADERWYLVNGWNLVASGAGTTYYHRTIDVNKAQMLSEGTTIATPGSASGDPYWYICKPSLVTGSDVRYTADPRALYFERIMRIGELTQYLIGATETSSGDEDVAFPTDFTDGLLLHVSNHDVSWSGLLDSGADAVVNLLNEISDADRVRFAESILAPFKRTTFPTYRVRGASEAEGRGTLTYTKLPVDW